MDLIFENGDRLNPKGHALIYFRSNVDHNAIAATYIVVLPISVEISKYVPPFLMSQVGNMDEQNLSAFAFPPIPEEMPDESAVNRLANLRNDDLLYGGEIDLNNPTSCMEKINELKGKKNIIIISHRQTTVSNCDRIFQISNGALVEL